MTQKPSMWQRAKQIFAKPTQGLVRQFAAARLDRLSGDWFATASSINQELMGDLDRLRQRGRQLVNNNDYARKFVGMVQNNIVGPSGIRLQSRPEDGPGKPDKGAGDAIEKAWAEWSQACDVTGQLTLRDLCENIVGSLPSDGEFLVKMVRGADAGNRFNFALQVIDVDRIDTTFNGSHAGNTVIMGVEVNAYRKPVALHLFEAHPNDGTRSSRRRVRVSTEDTIHRFKLERAEQVRGIPWMAPSMLSLHHLGAFKLSALLAAEHGANHYGFFTTPDGAAPMLGQTENGQQITTSQPGTYDTLPTGVTFQPHESRYPNETFGPFVKTTLQRIATGWRVAYHSLANDLEGVSFSSIRSGTLEERDRWAADQEWFIAVFMEPVFQAWLQTSLLSGAITLNNGSALPASKIAKFKKHEWQARRWDWVDPKGDMEAKILSVKAGLISPQDLCSSMGYDFEDTLKAIAAAQALAKEYNVNLNAYDGTPGASPANGNGAATGTTPAPADTTQKALIDMVRAMAERGQAPITIQQPATQVNFNTKSIEESAERMLNDLRDAWVKQLEEMPIQIIVPDQPAPIVNVAAPIVRMTNAAPVVNVTNEVPAAQVVVQHPVKARQTVERDKDGEIKATVTEYTTEDRSA